MDGMARVASLTAALCLVAVSSHSALANVGSLKALEPAGDRRPLLGGHLTVQIPPGALADTFPAAAFRDLPQRMTGYSLHAGSEQLVLIAIDEMATPGPDFEDVVRRETGCRAPCRVERIELPRVRRALLVIPSAEQVRQSKRVLMLYIVENNDTIQRLVFSINDAAANDPDGAIMLASKVARTVAGGQLRSVGGQVALPRKLSIALPPEWVIAQDGRMSMGGWIAIDVFRLVPFHRPLDEHDAANLELWIRPPDDPRDRLPPEFQADVDAVVKKVPQAAGRNPHDLPGRLLGKPVRWLASTRADGEQVREVELTRSDGTKLRLSMIAKSERDFEEPMRIAETLK
jgi:hypothetical protein